MEETVLEHAAVLVVYDCRLVDARTQGRAMQRLTGMREVEEERFVAAVADELHRLVGQSIGEVFALFSIRQHIPDRALTSGWDLPVARVLKKVAAGRPVSVAADVHIKPMMFWQTERLAAEMPFADAGG